MHRLAVLSAAVCAAAFWTAPAAASLTRNEMALISAAQDCRASEVATLIQHGTKVNVANSGQYTPLMMAAMEGCDAVVRQLLEAGADPATRNPDFGTAADLARMHRHRTTVDLLTARAAPAPTPARAAAPAPQPRAVQSVAERPRTESSPAAPAPGRSAWPAPGTYKTGERVLFSGTAGKTWEEGTIRSVDPRYGYNIEGWSGSYDPFFVVAPEREPFWTGYFVGDWRISVPMATGTVTDGTYVYRTVSGGMRLPPLRISADGTYAWRSQQNGQEKLIRGRWDANPEGPGVILRKAENEADWLVYNNTRTRGELGDTVIVSSECCTHYDGRRLK